MRAPTGGAGQVRVRVRLARRRERTGGTHYGDFVAHNLDLGSAEMLERNNAGETRTVQHVPCVGQTVYRQAEMPYLRTGRRQSWAHKCSARRRRTRCPASTQSDSLSTTSLRRRTLSSMRVMVTSSSDGLRAPTRERHRLARRRHTYPPSGFVVARRHGRDLGVDGDDPLEGALRRGLHHFCVDLRDDASILVRNHSAASGSRPLTVSSQASTPPSLAQVRT